MSCQSRNRPTLIQGQLLYAFDKATARRERKHPGKHSSQQIYVKGAIVHPDRSPISSHENVESWHHHRILVWMEEIRQIKAEAYDAQHKCQRQQQAEQDRWAMLDQCFSPVSAYRCHRATNLHPVGRVRYRIT